MFGKINGGSLGLSWIISFTTDFWLIIYIIYVSTFQIDNFDVFVNELEVCGCVDLFRVLTS